MSLLDFIHRRVGIGKLDRRQVDRNSSINHIGNSVV